MASGRRPAASNVHRSGETFAAPPPEQPPPTESPRVGNATLGGVFLGAVGGLFVGGGLVALMGESSPPIVLAGMFLGAASVGAAGGMLAGAGGGPPDRQWRDEHEEPDQGASDHRYR